MFGAFIRKHWFFIGLLLVILTGINFPEIGISLKPWINLFVSVGMLLIGFRFNSSELSISRKGVTAALIAVLCSFLIMPLTSYALGKLFFAEDREMFIGIILAGAVPTTQASSVIWTDLSGGNHSLALILMTVINVVGVFLSPFLLSFQLGSAVSVPVWPMLKTLLLFILLPVTLGVLARKLFSQVPRSVVATSRVVSIVLIWVTVLTALSSGNILTLPLPKVLFCVCLQYWGTAVASFILSRLCGLSTQDAVAVMFCSAQVTITFAAVIGFSYFSSRSIVYVVVYHLFQQFMGQFTARWMKRQIT